jgi:hypothetical protein
VDDDLCTCGHILAEHEVHLPGACTVDGCECVTFDWEMEGEEP